MGQVVERIFGRHRNRVRPRTQRDPRLQLAVFAPAAVPPVALTPLTVTDDTPLLPSPLSLAVPVTVRLGLVTMALLDGEVIATAGPVVSTEK